MKEFLFSQILLINTINKIQDFLEIEFDNIESERLMLAQIFF